MHFLFDNCTHGVRQFIGHRIQKSELRIDLLLRECAHSNELLEEPLIRLAELSELDGHVAFVDDVNNKPAETPVKIDTILLTEARFSYNFLLHVCQAAIDPDLLSIEVKGTETGYQFFIHLVPFEPGVLEHFHGKLVLTRLKDTLFIEATIDHLQNLVCLFYLFGEVFTAVHLRYALILGHGRTRNACNSCRHFI